MSRRHDDVLTDYVRDRLDRLVAGATDPDSGTESALRTVVRPRPALGRPQDHPAAGAAPEWWTGVARAPAEASPAPEAEPTDLVGSRPLVGRFTRQHLLVVGVVLAVGVLVAAFALTRARTVPIETPVPMTVTTATNHPVAPAPMPHAASPAASPAAEPIRVHVVGEVQSPGVHRVPPGARVADAIEAAGGLTERARLGELNLAQLLADGQQVVIGGPQRASEVRGGQGGGGEGGGEVAAAPGSAGGATAGKLNLNTATAAQLDTLPGVGPVTAEKVVSWRTQHGRFTRVEELQEVPGIGPKTYAEIAPHVTV